MTNVSVHTQVFVNEPPAVKTHDRGSWPITVEAGTASLFLTLEAAAALYSRLWPAIMAAQGDRGAAQLMAGGAPQGGSRADGPLAASATSTSAEGVPQ